MEVAINGRFAFSIEDVQNQLSQLLSNDNNYIDPVKDALINGLEAVWDIIKDHMAEFSLHLSEQIKIGASGMMKDMIDLILTTPTVASNPVLLQIWAFTKTVSFCLIGLMFVWEGFKKVTSHGSVGKTVEFKDMFIRMVYGLMLAVFSLDIVDIIINFNNALVETMKDNFSMTVTSTMGDAAGWSLFISILLVMAQIILMISVAIQYFMRMGEIWIMAILGPVVYTLWIHPNFSGYLNSWMRRLVTTIFTSFIWSLILVLYAAMVGTVSTTGTIWGMCMSIALLLIMYKTPNFLRQFMDSHDNPLQIMNLMRKQAINKGSLVKSYAKGISGKVGSWIKPKVT